MTVLLIVFAVTNLGLLLLCLFGYILSLWADYCISKDYGAFSYIAGIVFPIVNFIVLLTYLSKLL